MDLEGVIHSHPTKVRHVALCVEVSVSFVFLRNLRLSDDFLVLFCYFLFFVSERFMEDSVNIGFSELRCCLWRFKHFSFICVQKYFC